MNELLAKIIDAHGVQRLLALDIPRWGCVGVERLREAPRNTVWDEASFRVTAMDNKISRRKLVMGAATATIDNRASARTYILRRWPRKIYFGVRL
jgi:hypothetical protein